MPKFETHQPAEAVESALEKAREEYVSLASLRRPEAIGSGPLYDLYEEMTEIEPTKFVLYDRAWCALEVAEACRHENDPKGVVDMLQLCSAEVAALNHEIGNELGDRTDVRSKLLSCHLLYFAAHFLDESPDVMAAAAKQAFHATNEQVVALLLTDGAATIESNKGGLLSEVSILQLANWQSDGRQFFTPSSRRENSAWGDLKGGDPLNVGFDLRFYSGDDWTPTMVRPSKLSDLPSIPGVARIRAFDYTPRLEGEDSVLYTLLLSQTHPELPLPYETALVNTKKDLLQKMEIYRSTGIHGR